MRKITLTEPGLAGTYTVESQGERNLLLRPEVGPSEEEMLSRLGARRATPEELERAFGDLPSDDEG